jgi:hypothetical protein
MFGSQRLEIGETIAENTSRMEAVSEIGLRFAASIGV